MGTLSLVRMESPVTVLYKCSATGGDIIEGRSGC